MALNQRIKKLEASVYQENDILFVILPGDDDNWKPSPGDYEKARQQALVNGNNCALIAKNPDDWGI